MLPLWPANSDSLEAAEAKAGRGVVEELARLRRGQDGLRIRHKGHPDKPARAGRLRREMALSARRIAERRSRFKAA